jgi:hypothetical protein
MGSKKATPAKTGKANKTSETIWIAGGACALAIPTLFLLSQSSNPALPYLLFAVLCGLVGGAIGRAKNRASEGVLLGLLLGPLGILLIACFEKLMPAGRTERKCPDCAEMILAEAKKCKHCGSTVGPAVQAQTVS